MPSQSFIDFCKHHFSAVPLNSYYVEMIERQDKINHMISELSIICQCSKEDMLKVIQSTPFSVDEYYRMAIALKPAEKPLDTKTLDLEITLHQIREKLGHNFKNKKE